MQASSSGVTFLPASDCSLLVSFGDQITLEAHHAVVRLLRLLQSDPIPGVRNFHPAYSSLLITFDLLRQTHGSLETLLRAYLDRLEKLELPEPRLVEIPVCYDPEFGPDLSDVAALHQITTEKVVELHSAHEYVVYFLGFVPGFAYLGELPEALATPRLATPRRSVPPGSVGIAGRQTGVYPFATPGGWRLLGRTPLAMFRRDREPMNLLKIGDRVRFVSMPVSEYEALVKSA